MSTKKNTTSSEEMAFEAEEKIHVDDLKVNQEKEIKMDWKRLLNYQSIVKQIPFFLFLAVLAVVYIYNGHFADNTIRQINKTAKEVKELQYEYKTIKSEVMFRSKQSELVRAVEPIGLKELTESPVILENEVKN